MDSYVRPLIYQDTRGTCSSPIESNTCEQLKALNCPLAFFMWILDMTYSIHRKHNSIFPFFKIHIFKSILVFPTTNPTAIGRHMAAGPPVESLRCMARESHLYLSILSRLCYRLLENADGRAHCGWSACGWQ